MAKSIYLILLLLKIAEVPFDILQCMLCILYGLSSVLLCIPFIFADSERCQLLAHDLFFNPDCLYFNSGYFDNRGVLQKVLIRTAGAEQPS